MRPIFVASDHAGVKTKNAVLSFFKQKKIVFEDLSLFNKESDDYPDFAFEVSREVVNNKSLGVLVCGTGIGMSIAANKHKGIRAALCRTPGDAELSRKHNDANILVLSNKTPKKDVSSIVSKFLLSSFEKGRHSRRLRKIKLLEK